MCYQGWPTYALSIRRRSVGQSFTAQRSSVFQLSTFYHYIWLKWPLSVPVISKVKRRCHFGLFNNPPPLIPGKYGLFVWLECSLCDMVIWSVFLLTQAFHLSLLSWRLVFYPVVFVWLLKLVFLLSGFYYTTLHYNQVTTTDKKNIDIWWHF